MTALNRRGFLNKCGIGAAAVASSAVAGSQSVKAGTGMTKYRYGGTTDRLTEYPPPGYKHVFGTGIHPDRLMLSDDLTDPKNWSDAKPLRDFPGTKTKRWQPKAVPLKIEYSWDGELIGKAVNGKFTANEPLCIQPSSEEVVVSSIRHSKYAGSRPNAMDVEIYDWRSVDAWCECKYVVVKGSLYRLVFVQTRDIHWMKNVAEGAHYCHRRLRLTKLCDLDNGCQRIEYTHPQMADRPFTIPNHPDGIIRCHPPKLKSFRVMVRHGNPNPGLYDLHPWEVIHIVHRVIDESEAIASIVTALSIDDASVYEFEATPLTPPSGPDLVSIGTNGASL